MSNIETKEEKEQELYAIIQIISNAKTHVKNICDFHEEHKNESSLDIKTEVLRNLNLTLDRLELIRTELGVEISTQEDEIRKYLAEIQA